MMGLWGRLAKWARQLVASAMATHAVPRHVAFILDGNRRFAERRHLRRIEGHQAGYQKLLAALEWCLELGVECVSVYAFSIDNYKRSQVEVDLLMRLAEEKLGTMLEEQDVLVQHGVQVRVIGDLSLTPLSVQSAAARVMDATRHHTKAVLNICLSYTASQEMLQALDRAALDAACSSSPPRVPSDGGSGSSRSSIYGDGGSFLDAYMYTQGCPPIDLLIRTSGETRLSDFLLWQSRHALLVFTHVLWPDFGFLDLLSALVQYQRSKPTLDREWRAAAAALQARGGRGLREALATPALALAAAAAASDSQQAQRRRPPQQQQQEEEEEEQGMNGRSPQLQLRPPCQASSPAARPQHQQQNGFPPGSTAMAAEAAAAEEPFAPVCEPLLSGDGIAVVKALQLGGESPWGGSPRGGSPRGIASPEAPSSPSGAASPQAPPTWDRLLLLPARTPSSGSLGGTSPHRSTSNGSGNGFAFRSPSGHRLGSVESFTSIDLNGDGSGGSLMAQRRQRLSSYQDLLEAMGD